MDSTLISEAVSRFSTQMLVFMQRWEQDYQSQRRRRMRLLLLRLYSTNLFYRSHRLLRRRNRLCWIKPRSCDWWDNVVPMFTNEDWKQNFKVTKSTFDFICNRLDPYLKPNKNLIRPSTGTQKKVAIALYKLASCAEYRVVANQFGTHKSVIQQYLYRFSEAVIAEFTKDYLSFPCNSEVDELTHGFKVLCGIPNIIGAIDGTHMPVLPPKDGYRNFVKRKGWPSYNVLAIVDNAYRYIYLSI